MITKYLINKNLIDDKTQIALEPYLEDPHIDELFVFPDVHYSNADAMPVGVAFSSKKVYPLIAGGDIGCGVGYLKIPKKFVIKLFNKSKHYRALYKAHLTMTDEGLGGGNHFLALEEDSNNWYIICHTGTRNRGIAMYQKLLKLQKDFKYDSGLDVKWIDKNYISEDILKKYKVLLEHSRVRRYEFCQETLNFLIRNKYVISKEEMKEQLIWSDSIHNYIDFTGNKIIHRKGATGLNDDGVEPSSPLSVVIPLSMSRGSLIVKRKYDYALNSCSHGAGRKLSRTQAIKHWKNLKKKQKNRYRSQFQEMLNKNGDFDTRYIQELDFAYKKSNDILKSQPHLIKITETKPICTIKLNV